MKSNFILFLSLIASSVFAASATFPGAGNATGNVDKVIYAGAGVANTANAVFFEVECGVGCVNTYWLGLEEKNALSIVLTAKSTNAQVTVFATSGTNGWTKLNDVYCSHADILFIP